MKEYNGTIYRPPVEAIENIDEEKFAKAFRREARSIKKRSREMARTIFDEVKLNKMTLKNRLVRSATWEALADNDGAPTTEQVEIYRELAKGGIGMIITGFTTVDEYDNYFGGMARISSDELGEKWRVVADVAHAENVPIVMQLALGEFVRRGRELEPDDLSKEQIAEVIELFANAAERAAKAGFDGVQIHAAHNFYLSRFISPAYNHRQDEYGGSVNKRARILTEVLEKIRAKAPDIHVTMKINCSDFMQGGLSPEDSLETILIMEKAGLDSVEISGNGTSVSGLKAGRNEGYFAPFARELKKHSKLPVILVGGHRSIECMNEIVENDGIEMLSLSRPLIREPNLINRWQAGDKTPAKCVSCNACYRTPGHKCIFVLRGVDG